MKMGVWSHGVIKEANNSNHGGISYIIGVMKMGRLIMWNTRQIHNTPITTKQYLRGQIKKGTR